MVTLIGVAAGICFFQGSCFAEYCSSRFYVNGYTVGFHPRSLSSVKRTANFIFSLFLFFSSQVFLFATCLWYISSAINPVIYGVMNSTFRAEYRQIFSFITASSVGISPPNSTPDDGQEMFGRIDAA